MANLTTVELCVLYGIARSLSMQRQPNIYHTAYRKGTAVRRRCHRVSACVSASGSDQANASANRKANANDRLLALAPQVAVSESGSEYRTTKRLPFASRPSPFASRLSWYTVLHNFFRFPYASGMLR